MQQFLIFCICSFMLISCKKQENKMLPASPVKNNTFVIHGKLDQYKHHKVYLNKIIENSIYAVDSATVTQNEFSFEGSIGSPERFALTFDSNPTPVLFILENDTIEMEFNPKEFHDPVIKGSALNTELENYKMSSKIFLKNRLSLS